MVTFEGAPNTAAQCEMNACATVSAVWAGMGIDKEAYVRGTCEGVEHHLWSSNSRPACRAICALRFSKPVPHRTEIRAEGGELLTDA